MLRHNSGDSNLPTPRGESALTKAARKGHTASVAVLLAAGAEHEGAVACGYTDVTCTFLARMVREQPELALA